MPNTITEATAGMMLPESTPEREELRDKVWDAWDAYVLATTEQQRKARRRAFRAAQKRLADYDRQLQRTNE
ncbi:MAG: hypothetical protein BWY57_03353 [Betaproteobacteria bacterium ADurb.Bin341]|nr:MAG: hypothetical protein BWY57_03353 [Betaproteobacteria bacterium ADurb.Bin341]